MNSQETFISARTIHRTTSAPSRATERKAAGSFDLQVLGHTPDTPSSFELTIKLGQDPYANHWSRKPWKMVIIEVSRSFV